MGNDAPASHYAYGLRIRSALTLPDLPPSDGPPDIEVRLGKLPRVPPGTAVPWVRAADGEAHLSWRGVGGFLVRAGREVVVDPDPGADGWALRLFLVGPVLAVLLRERGYLVLHGSAVERSGLTIAFLGPAGWGKSTLAAALCSRGHRLVTDDVLAVITEGPRPLALPGLSHLKLWPEAAAALGETPHAWPRVHPEFQKLTWSLREGICDVPAPLHRLYVLTHGAPRAVEPLKPRDALVELLRHSYGARTLRGIDPALHLHHCARVAVRVPARRLVVRRSLDALPQLAELIEKDAADAA